MELRHLRYFVAVAEELNFTRAAEREMVAQSSLSQQIQDFESELGLQLFARSTRKTELTAAGHDLLADARAILKRVERFEQRARRSSRGQLGRLRLAAISNLANAELAELLRGFRREHPEIDVGLDVHPSLWQVAALREGTIDAGFVTLPDSLLTGLSRIRVRSGKMGLAVPTGHRLDSRASLRWRDLEGESLIFVDPGAIIPDYYTGFVTRCREAGFEPEVGQYATNGVTQIFMVSAGLGLAPIYIPGRPGDWPGVKILALPEDAPALEVLFVWRLASPALDRFVTHLRGFYGV